MVIMTSNAEVCLMLLVAITLMFLSSVAGNVSGATRLAAALLN